eukprot:scaffold16092_cov127-Isochrysis_galbana.AAC.6
MRGWQWSLGCWRVVMYDPGRPNSEGTVPWGFGDVDDELRAAAARPADSPSTAGEAGGEASSSSKSIETEWRLARKGRVAPRVEASEPPTDSGSVVVSDTPRLPSKGTSVHEGTVSDAPAVPRVVVVAKADAERVAASAASRSALATAASMSASISSSLPCPVSPPLASCRSDFCPAS